MKNKKVFLIILLVIIGLGCIGDKSKLTDQEKKNISVTEKGINNDPTREGTNIKQSTGRVVVTGHQMLVDGKPFIIKGVGYSPVPIGEGSKDYYTSNYADIYNRDLPILRKMGANTVRLWYWNNNADHADFLNKAYNDGKDPIYVIASFGISFDADISSPDIRNKIKSDFRKMVAKYKDNPAILMWIIGNELNAKGEYIYEDLFSLTNEMAKEAHIEEGANYHPVAITMVDRNLTDVIKKYDPRMTSLDVWSVQLYRGKSFGNFFREYSNASSKPVVVLEFGIDSYDNNNHTEYQNTQAEYMSALWKHIQNNLNITIGGAVTTYSDAWWKGKGGRASPGCPENNASFHSDCGYPLQSHPDGYSNEEWWGIVSIKDNGTSPDIIEPKEAYYALNKLWVK